MVNESVNFLDHFKDLKDYRVERTKLHGMNEILFLTLCGVLCGCEGWTDIEDFGKSRLIMLRKYLPFKNGMPSDDTLRRFFRSIDPQELNRCFMSWIGAIVKQEHLNGSVIAIDGKTAKSSHDAEQAPLHMVSAYATDLRLILCQEKVADKSNEITAIPKLLSLLDLRGAIVTIDAMGTQKKIAQAIIEKEGDYVLALKRNQGDMYEEVDTFFQEEAKNTFKDVAVSQHSTAEKGHGRIEHRTCIVASAKSCSKRADWVGIKSIVQIDSTREIKGKTTQEIRYYITSIEADAEKLLSIIRSHWSIENSVHWVLDMNFGEDQSRTRKENAPENMAVVRHLALNLLNNAKAAFGQRVSIRRIRQLAGWQDAALDTILAANF